MCCVPMSSRGLSSPYADNEKMLGKDTEKDKKNASSHSPLFLLTLFFVVMAGVGVFGMNYWHSVRCHEAHSVEEIDDMYQTLQKKLLHVESQTLASSLEMEKFVSAMGEKLAIIEDAEMDKLKAHKSQSKEGGNTQGHGLDIMKKIVYDDDTVIKVQLALAKQPSPLKHKFHLDQKYINDADVLFDKINEILVAVDADGGAAYEEHHSDAGARGSHRENDATAKSILSWATDDFPLGSNSNNKEGGDSNVLPPSEMTAGDLLAQREKEHQDDDFLYIPSASEKEAAHGGGGSSSSGGVKREKHEGSTNVAKDPHAVRVATKTCNQWLSEYGVVVGVSWGSLPYDLQDKWLDIGCDGYITKVDEVRDDAGAA